MQTTLINFAGQLQYLFTHLTVSQVLDITLVAGLIFVAFQALYQTHTLQILRGVIIVAFLGGALLVLLPLTTFSWMVRLVLLAGVIAIPFLFQDELRRVLVQLGQFGRQRGKIPDFERFKHALIQTASQLSDQSLGGLIVLEGQTIIEDIIETGVRMDAGVITPELLMTIFHPRTPLHDGAVVIRGDRLAAAGCILPVQTGDMSDPHLGTRHRAGLGLSLRVPDALVIIVSEETGRLSIAHDGLLHLGLSLKELDDWIIRFGEQEDPTKQIRWGWLGGGGLRSSLTNALTAVLLALIAWTIVTYQTNPPKMTTLQELPLIVEGLADGLIITNDIPDSVDIDIRSSQDRIDTFSVANVKAALVLDGFEAGVFSTPVRVSIPEPALGSVSVKPAVIDVIIEPEVSMEVVPNVAIKDIEDLASGNLIDQVALDPSTIWIIGPESKMEDVFSANLEIQLNGRQSTFQEEAVPVIVDSEGQVIPGISINPKQVIVTVNILRTIQTVDVGVLPDIDRNSLSKDYEIKGVSIDPAAVTLSGSRDALESVGPYLPTAPITLTNQLSDTTLSVPLLVPEGITVLNSQGDVIRNVNVDILISPVTGYLVVQKVVQLRNVNEDYKALLSNSIVSLLLVGPQVLLDEISINPELVVVYLDLANLPAGTHTLTPAFDLPDGIDARPFPREVEVVLQDGA